MQRNKKNKAMYATMTNTLNLLVGKMLNAKERCITPHMATEHDLHVLLGTCFRMAGVRFGIPKPNQTLKREQLAF